ncbi:unnamed protein product [Haemonchus placei]|uniref:RMI1_N domain-containing protein n=1 Tax=Haemonchus placei TaxID=6290 RepID=A0A0N4WJ90_HAEPC|nr:unnamed protein product [Haemonchus placei]
MMMLPAHSGPLHPFPLPGRTNEKALPLMFEGNRIGICIIGEVPLKSNETAKSNLFKWIVKIQAGHGKRQLESSKGVIKLWETLEIDRIYPGLHQA